MIKSKKLSKIKNLNHGFFNSKGGTSKDAKNIRLYCRRHNLEKSDKIGK